MKEAIWSREEKLVFENFALPGNADNNVFYKSRSTESTIQDVKDDDSIFIRRGRANSVCIYPGVYGEKYIRGKRAYSSAFDLGLCAEYCLCDI